MAKKANPTVALIDWHGHSQVNSFIFTEEFRVSRSGGAESRRPDIVCFVNGLPLAVIEANRPDSNAQKIDYRRRRFGRV
jgi:type I restriction enzyme R subunit